MSYPDFVALVTARVQSDDRPQTFQFVPLDYRAVAELNQAEAELEQAKMLANLNDRLNTKEDSPDPDPRMAGKPGLLAHANIAELQERVDDLMQRVINSTVCVVFKAPSSDRQAVLSAEAKALEQSPLQQAKVLALESFEHFEWDGQRIEELNSTHFSDLLSVMSQGEVYGISTPLTELSGGQPQLPKFVMESVSKRALNGTLR